MSFLKLQLNFKRNYKASSKEVEFKLILEIKVTLKRWKI